MQTSILNNNKSSNALSIGHSKIQKRFGFTEINGQILSEALRSIDTNLDGDKYIEAYNEIVLAYAKATQDLNAIEEELTLIRNNRKGGK